jgi:hypothetical protein
MAQHDPKMAQHGSKMAKDETDGFTNPMKDSHDIHESSIITPDFCMSKGGCPRISIYSGHCV